MISFGMGAAAAAPLGQKRFGIEWILEHRHAASPTLR